jgi:hypothetical protein
MVFSVQVCALMVGMKKKRKKKLLGGGLAVKTGQFVPYVVN